MTTTCRMPRRRRARHQRCRRRCSAAPARVVSRRLPVDEMQALHEPQRPVHFVSTKRSALAASGSQRGLLLLLLLSPLGGGDGGGGAGSGGRRPRCLRRRGQGAPWRAWRPRRRRRCGARRQLLTAACRAAPPALLLLSPLPRRALASTSRRAAAGSGCRHHRQRALGSRFTAQSSRTCPSRPPSRARSGRGSED